MLLINTVQASKSNPNLKEIVSFIKITLAIQMFP